LSLVVDPGSAWPSSVEQLLATWARVSGDRSSIPEVAPEPLRVVGQLPEAAQWRDSVARLAGAVGRGRLDKVVLSRRVELQTSEVVGVAGALRRLVDSAAGSTIFAFGRGSSTFLGATPERLVSLRRGQVETMAMAGSAGRASDPAADDELAARLLESDKEREEHAVVVAMLRDALAPLTTDLRISQRPVVERFRHVQHLVTPISGQLLAEADVLALVERLHPTPAVAGAPRDLALELIAEEEPDDRGWYAGPVGWLDQHGDGEFAVALRSGLVSGDRATLFAGCGIVADSDPDREWQESAMKLLALSSALGRVQS
jgi:salicylate biosynthesis isochorismate synthase